MAGGRVAAPVVKGRAGRPSWRAFGWAGLRRVVGGHLKSGDPVGDRLAASTASVGREVGG